jgi:hypothetical protein
VIWLKQPTTQHTYCYDRRPASENMVKNWTQLRVNPALFARRAPPYAEFDDVGAIVLGTIDDDAVFARLYPGHFDQSSSASRLTAGAAGFLVLIQSRERPER